MNKLLIAIVVILIMVGAVIFKGSLNKASPAKSTVQPAQSSETKTNIETAIVTVSQSGFEPQALTVKVGTKVAWTNKSGADDVSVNSAEHPTHLVYPPLNLGQFNNGSSVELVFNKAGTYSYHNHLNPSQIGTIIVTP